MVLEEQFMEDTADMAIRIDEVVSTHIAAMKMSLKQPPTLVFGAAAAVLCDDSSTCSWKPTGQLATHLRVSHVTGCAAM
jgi:hypothetical protein